MTEPIDLVYAWCDDADPKWRAKREAAAARCGVTFDAVHNGACRYRGGDMLRYSLRSVFRFASWVRQIVCIHENVPSPVESGETVSRFDCVFSCVVHVAFLSFDADIIAYFAHCMVKISLRLEIIWSVVF